MSNVVKAIVAVWVGMLVLSGVVQTTALFRSVNGSIAWLLLGGSGVVLLFVLGVTRLFVWLDSEQRGRQGADRALGDGRGGDAS